MLQSRLLLLATFMPAAVDSILTSKCTVPLVSSNLGVASSRLIVLLGNTDTLLGRINNLRGVRICSRILKKTAVAAAGIQQQWLAAILWSKVRRYAGVCTWLTNDIHTVLLEELSEELTAYLSPNRAPAFPLFINCPFFNTERWNLQKSQKTCQIV